MQTSHKLSRIFVALAALIVFSFSALAQGNPNIVFDGAPGTSAPPATLGGYTMVPFPADARPDFTIVNDVAVPAGSLCGGVVGFNPALEKRTVPGGGWATWSHGYASSVYALLPGTTETLTLPAATTAFYFYAEPNNFGSFTVQATAADGTTSGPIAVTGLAGARYFGFYTTCDVKLTSITITVAAGAGGFAVGEFAITCASPSSVSDQKAGSLLVFPYYTSNAVSKKDTRVTLSNIGATKTAVHVFFMDASCNQADTYVCLTPNASVAIKASEFDPEVSGGWIIATAVDANGIPTVANNLIGNAFVVDGDYNDNYSAEAFWAFSNGVDNGDSTASVFFGRTHNSAPNQFAAEIQSPNDAVGQKIVTVGLGGDVTKMTLTGAGQVGIGQLYNGNEKPFGSFSKFLTNGCRSEATITGTAPRVPLGLGVLIPSGQVGTMKWNSGPSVGLLMTPRGAKWSGIRTLHKTCFAGITELKLPVFNPGC